MFIRKEMRVINTPKKVLLIQTAFIGDVVLITPLIQEIINKYPSVLLDVIVVPECVKILENNPNINNIYSFDKRKMSILSFLKFIKMLGSKRYDMSFSPHSSFRSGLISFLSRIPIRIGFKRNFQQLFLTNKIKHPSNIHKRLKNIALLGISDFKQHSYATKLYPSTDNYLKVSDLMSKLSKSQKTIIVAPGSVWYTKMWPLENYIELVNRLLEIAYNVVLIGSKNEKYLSDRIMESVKNENKQNLLSVIGDFDILDSAALIEKSDLVICNDSGALHIANATKTPVYAIFGPTTKDMGYFPFNENDMVFEVDIYCRPCGRHGGKICPEKHFKCMRMITVDVILNHL